MDENIFVIQDRYTDEYIGSRGGRYADENYLTEKQVNKFISNHTDDIDRYEIIKANLR